MKVSDLWMEFVRNKPLRVVAFFFITAFAMMSVGNAADAYFMSYNVGATPLLTTLFMWLGTIPAFIFMPLVPAIKRKIGKKGTPSCPSPPPRTTSSSCASPSS